MKKFKIIHTTDTHIGDSHGISRNTIVDYWKKTFNWIVDNKEEENIVAVVHTGDVVDLGYEEPEFQTAEQAMDILYDSDLPVIYAMGNHDYDDDNDTDWSSSRNASNANNYFGLDKVDHKPSFGGARNDSIENAYYTIQVGFLKILFMAMEYRPRPEIAQWWKDVHDDHSDHIGIVCTHEFNDGGRTGGYRDSARVTMKEFIKKMPNVREIWCGHCLSNGRHPITTHSNGNHWSWFTEWPNKWVNALFFNFQAASHQNNYEPYHGDGHRGFGRVRIMEFNTHTNEVSVSNYTDYDSGYPKTVKDNKHLYTYKTALRI